MIENDGINAESIGPEIWTADFQDGKQMVKSISVLSINKLDRISKMKVTVSGVQCGNLALGKIGAWQEFVCPEGTLADQVQLERDYNLDTFRFCGIKVYKYQLQGEECSKNGDCFGDLACIQGTCDIRNKGEECEETSWCADDLVCIQGICDIHE